MTDNCSTAYNFLTLLSKSKFHLIFEYAFQVPYERRGVNNGKAGKAAALPKFSDMLTLSQPRVADYAHPLALPHQKMFRDYAPGSAQVGLLHTCLWSDIHTDKIPAH